LLNEVQEISHISQAQAILADYGSDKSADKLYSMRLLPWQRKFLHWRNISSEVSFLAEIPNEVLSKDYFIGRDRATTRGIMPLSDYYPILKDGRSSPDQVSKLRQFLMNVTQVGSFCVQYCLFPLQYAPDTLKQYNVQGFSSFRYRAFASRWDSCLKFGSQGIAQNHCEGHGLLLEKTEM